MKKNYFYGLLVLAIFAVIGCSDSFIQEPTPPLPEQQKEMTHEVTQAEARQQLEEILLDMKIPSTRGTMSSVPNITSAHTTGKYTRVTRSTQEVEPYFHIFNFGNNEGFAIMSGDDRVEPLLALTYKGELTPDTEIESPAFKIAYAKMEEYYAEQVMRGGLDPILPIDSIADLPVDTIYFEGRPYNVYYDMPYGHCPVTWGQGVPYNEYCYTVEGARAKTGCVATAVAQLMAIYKYPSSYNGFNFNWTSMIAATPVAYEDTDPAVEMIAQLMSQLGKPQNLDMDYGTTSSGAYPQNIPRTLDNFGYSVGGSLVNYNTSQVSNELKLGYPVLIGGHDSAGDGHRWLGHGIMERKVDGTAYLDGSLEPIATYTRVEETYILCNFGWGGYADGYYLSECFDTEEGPVYSFSANTTRAVDDNNYSNTITVVKGIRR